VLVIRWYVVCCGRKDAMYNCNGTGDQNVVQAANCPAHVAPPAAHRFAFALCNVQSCRKCLSIVGRYIGRLAASQPHCDTQPTAAEGPTVQGLGLGQGQRCEIGAWLLWSLQAIVCALRCGRRHPHRASVVYPLSSLHL